MKRIDWRNAGVYACIALLVSGSIAAAGSRQNAPSDVPVAAYEHAQTLVTIAGGRRLNLFCMGAGTPVVVMEAGGGDDSLSFRRVQARIAAVTRVCSYDRAGMGFSDPSDGPSTAAHTVGDLHALIQAAALPTPVVLVGHSDGGLYARLYAEEYPQEVAGMVLIDPMAVGQDVVAERALDDVQLRKWLASDQKDIKDARQCLALAKSGALARTPRRYRNCLDNPPNASATLHKIIDAQMAKSSEQEAMLTETLDTYPPANGGLSNAEKIAQRMPFNFGDKPLVVMTATHEDVGDNLPVEQRAKVLQALSANEDALAAYSSRGVHIKVECKGEYIQIHRPVAVIQAVVGVVATIRGKKTPGT